MLAELGFDLLRLLRQSRFQANWVIRSAEAANRVAIELLACLRLLQPFVGLIEGRLALSKALFKRGLHALPPIGRLARRYFLLDVVQYRPGVFHCSLGFAHLGRQWGRHAL